MQLESAVSGLGLSDKLENINLRDSHHLGATQRNNRSDASPLKCSTPVILGYTETREPRAPRMQHQNSLLNPSPLRGRSVGREAPNKSFDLPAANNYNDSRAYKLTEVDDKEGIPSCFVKIHSTPLKSVEVVTHCPLTGIVILGGLGKTDLHQTRMIATMDIKGMSEILKTASCHASQMNGVLVKDGLVFTYSKDAFVKVWKTDTLENTMAIKHDGSVLNLDYDSVNKRLFTCGKFGTVRVWNIDKNKELPAIRLSDTMLTTIVKFLPVRDWLAIGDGLTGKICIYDLNERIVLGQLNSQANSSFISLDYCYPINQMVSVYADGCIKVWDVTGMQKKKPLDAATTIKHISKNIICSAAVNFGAQTTFIANTGLRILRSNLQSGKVSPSIDLTSEGGIKSIVAVDALSDNKGIIIGCKSTGNIAVVISS